MAALSLNDRMATARAWSDFLGGLDLVWSRVPTTFYEGPFLGNDGLGAAVYRRTDSTRLSFTLGDSRVGDHQSAGGTNFGRARLPVGYLTLNTAGDVTDVDLRLSLWDAELSGTVTTSAGVLHVRAYTHARRDVLFGVLGAVLAGRSILPGNGFTATNGYPQLSLGDEPTLRAAGGTILYLELIALLSLGVGLVVRHTAAALAVVLAVLYAAPIIAQFVPDPHARELVLKYSPMSAGLAIQATRGLDHLPIGPWAGLGVLTAYAVGAVILGVVMFTLRDA